DVTLAHLRGGVGYRRAARIEVGAFLHERLGRRELHHPQLAAHGVDAADAFEHGDVAVGGDVDLLVGLLELDRAAAADHGITRRSEEHTPELQSHSDLVSRLL